MRFNCPKEYHDTNCFFCQSYTRRKEADWLELMFQNMTAIDGRTKETLLAHIAELRRETGGKVK